MVKLYYLHMNQPHWPHFFVAGAGKSGTTTLYEVLKHHPQIFVPAEKEPKYFGHTALYGNGAALSEDEYLALYDTAIKHQLRGDFSTIYFVCPQAPGRIYEKNKAARFIFILRDPVSRAFSDYLMLRRRDKLLGRDFIAEVRLELDRLQEGKLEWPFLVQTGLYYRNVRKFMDHFPREQFLFLSMTDLIESPHQVYRQIYEFLGIDDMPVSDVQLREKRNSFTEARSDILHGWLQGSPVSRFLAQVVPAAPKRALRNLRQQLLFRKAEKPQMPAEAWSLLQPIFDEDLRKLQILTGFDTDPLRKNWPRRRDNAELDAS